MTPDEAALERLRAYAAIENGAADKAQAESLARAADLVALYESMAWVPEMDAKHPVGRKQFGAGRPNDPRSFSRFTRWLTQVRGVDLKGSRQYQLKDANALLKDYFHGVETIPRTEWELRPLKRLVKQGYGDRIPDIWAEVIAEGDWTARTVTEKIADFRKGWTRGQARAATASEKKSARKSAALLALERAWEVDPNSAIEAINVFIARHNLSEEEPDAAPTKPDLRAV